MKLPFEIRVLSQREALEQQLWATHIISIVGSGATDLPEFFAGPIVKTIVFDDLQSEREEADRPGARVSPKMNHVRQLLDFSAGFKAGDKVIIHCHAGICRSAGGAMLIMAQHGMPVFDVIKELLKIRPHAWPNKMVVRLGDIHLGLESMLIHDLEDWMEAEIELGQDGNFIL